MRSASSLAWATTQFAQREHRRTALGERRRSPLRETPLGRPRPRRQLLVRGEVDFTALHAGRGVKDLAVALGVADEGLAVDPVGDALHESPQYLPSSVADHCYRCQIWVTPGERGSWDLRRCPGSAGLETPQELSRGVLAPSVSFSYRLKRSMTSPNRSVDWRRDLVEGGDDAECVKNVIVDERRSSRPTHPTETARSTGPCRSPQP